MQDLLLITAFFLFRLFTPCHPTYRNKLNEAIPHNNVFSTTKIPYIYFQLTQTLKSLSSSAPRITATRRKSGQRQLSEDSVCIQSSWSAFLYEWPELTVIARKSLPLLGRTGGGRGGVDKTVKWKAVTNERSDNTIVLPLVKISLATFS